MKNRYTQQCVLLLSTVCAVQEASMYSYEECESLGFNKEALECSLCDALASFVPSDPDLIAECGACCVETKDYAGVKYSTASLEICK